VKKAMLLPEGFENLEDFAESWAVKGSEARKRRRLDSTPEERAAFYAAALPYLDRGLEYLDGFEIETLSESQRRLMNLFLTLAHVSLAVEKQRDAEAAHAVAHARTTITRMTDEYS
jgi:hypothetical protein